MKRRQQIAQHPAAPEILCLGRLEDLFKAPAANPFSAYAGEILGQSGVDILRRRFFARRRRRGAPTQLQIRVPAAPEMADAAHREQQAAAVGAALRRYCAMQVERNRQMRRLAFVNARRELLIAAAVTGAALGLLIFFAVLSPTGTAALLLGVLTILAVFAASLAIWDALGSLFFDWTPYTFENQAYHWLGSITVQIAPQDE
jgi:hypothetical protein